SVRRGFDDSETARIYNRFRFEIQKRYFPDEKLDARSQFERFIQIIGARADEQQPVETPEMERERLLREYEALSEELRLLESQHGAAIIDATLLQRLAQLEKQLGVEQPATQAKDPDTLYRRVPEGVERIRPSMTFDEELAWLQRQLPSVP